MERIDHKRTQKKSEPQMGFFTSPFISFIMLISCSGIDIMFYYFPDIDECSKNGSPCSENAKCFNNDGSFTCICKDGFTGNGTVCLGKLTLKHFQFL